VKAQSKDGLFLPALALRDFCSTPSPPVTPAIPIRQAFPARYGKLTQILHQEATMNHSLKPWNTFGIDRSAKATMYAPKLSNSC
jgi:hypothetical protein